MMGHREKLASGDELDALTRGGKRIHIFRAGDRAKLKRRVNKRARRMARKGLTSRSNP